MATRAPSPRLRGREVVRGASPGAGADPAVRGPGQHVRLLELNPDARRRAIATLLATHLGDGGPVPVSSDPGLQFQAVDAFGDPAESLILHHPLVLEALYVSRRTVQTHLAHVFTKLGISSRTQLAAEATRRRGKA